LIDFFKENVKFIKNILKAEFSLSPNL